jgi:hypothetical protein
MNGTDTPSGILPTDDFSLELARLRRDPAAIEPKSTTIQTTTFYGHAEEWIIRTIRTDAGDTLFIRHIKANGGGGSYIIPPAVVAASNRQQNVITTIARRRGARRGFETRQAAGTQTKPPARPRKAGK